MSSSGRNAGATPLQSRFSNPYSVEADGIGNVYVADTNNHAVRMLSGTWVAGSMTGASGSTDNAVGTSAKFYYAYAVRANTAGGQLFVADYNNNKVRVVSTGGNQSVSTCASSLSYVSDIALNTAQQALYVAWYYKISIVTYAGAVTLLAGSSYTNSFDGVGSAAGFNNVIGGLALDALTGVLYATDSNVHSIRCITTGGEVSTVAGGYTSGRIDGLGTRAAFLYPWGVALDAGIGNLYVGDTNNHAIRLVRVQPPAVSSVALVVAPLPPSPVLPNHQLSFWRSLGTVSSTLMPPPLLDARSAAFNTSLTPANTAGINSAIVSLWLGTVSLVPRNAALAAAGNTNTTFATSAQRGLRKRHCSFNRTSGSGGRCLT